ncbi:Aste57867_14915 [Aphanomyces stellatus]|uniref:Aste57867_14915 protein n=1 Tax=Aphanomyces stellatus TaxID=120398 RepID=A0A485L2V6_9STRA|nr:hypothetical protein As57867_014859 [Aphanomyces stellatus]VFT91730.1 Aste57867_14915 [Aphanomyces stellatus]
MMKAFVTIGATLVAACAAWSPASTNDAAKVLYSAVAAANFPASNTQPICASTVLNATQQVTTGTKYKINLAGCPVADISNAAAGCTCGNASAYTVTVYQRLTDAPLITLIAPGLDAPDSPGLLVGAFSKSRDVTTDDTTLFAKATSVSTNYVKPSLPKVCGTDFVSVASSGVGDITYVFEVKGCALASLSVDTVCLSACAFKDKVTFQVQILQDLFQVRSVLNVVQATSNGAFLLPGSSGGGAAGEITTPFTTEPTIVAPPSSHAPRMSMAGVAASVAAAVIAAASHF